MWFLNIHLFSFSSADSWDLCQWVMLFSFSFFMCLFTSYVTHLFSVTHLTATVTSNKVEKQYFLYEHMMFSIKLLRMFKSIMHCICLSHCLVENQLG